MPPVTSTLVLHVILPASILFVFWRSERATKRWLGTQMDIDAELLDIINSGNISGSRIGHYVDAMKRQFTPEVVLDILCYLRLHVELAISAKGLLMMREAGFKLPVAMTATAFHDAVLAGTTETEEGEFVFPTDFRGHHT